MAIGVSTASLFLRQYNEDALSMLNEIDARVCEIFLECFSEYQPEYGELLLSRKGNLEVHSIHVVTMNYETELFSQNPRAFADAKKLFEGVLTIAKTLGAKNYTMHGRARVKRGGNYDDYELAGKRLELLAETAENYGVDVCLENVAWAFCNYPDFYRQVKRFSKRLRATLDIKQARLTGWGYEEYLDAFGKDIKTVHLSDVDQNGKIKLPGKGSFDFETLFKRLRDVGFDGNMLIEVYKDDFNGVEEIKQSLDYLREIEYKIF